MESLLRIRAELELSDQQVEALNALRADVLAERTAKMVEGMKIRSDFAAGEISREEIRDHMQALRVDRREQRETIDGQVDSILTIDQREALLERRERRVRQGDMRRRGRSEMRGNRGRRSGPRGQ